METLRIVPGQENLDVIIPVPSHRLNDRISIFHREIDRKEG